jgi:hypothetical protein
MAELVGIPKVSDVADHDARSIMRDMMWLQPRIFYCSLCGMDTKIGCRSHLMEISFRDIGSSEILDSAPKAAAKAQALALWDELNA